MASLKAAGEWEVTAKFRVPRGTKDILPEEVTEWRFVEETFRDWCTRYGYQEIRTPAFEDLGLFERTAGEASDIVQKQMFLVTPLNPHHRASGNERWVLRPEGTAPVARALLEHGLLKQTPFIKVFYITPIFRYERPQAGRLRQHHQCGVEALGSFDPALDAEIIALSRDFLTSVGADGFTVHLNSIGCLRPECRPRYREALTRFLKAHEGKLCKDCRHRLATNPLRVLDCKEEGCRVIIGEAPLTLDFLCPTCRDHFEALQRNLQNLGLPYELNGRLVRGLDYYTRTVFEFIHPRLGAQSTILGGGRYDGLVEELGGDPIPGIGFGCGIERVLLVRRAKGEKVPSRNAADVFIAVVSIKARETAFRLLYALRREGIRTEIDYLSRSLKGQMRYADKLGVRYVLFLGEDELRAETATLRDMREGDQFPVPFKDIVAILQERLKGHP